MPHTTTKPPPKLVSGSEHPPGARMGNGYRALALLAAAHTLTDFYAVLFQPLMKDFTGLMAISVPRMSILVALIDLLGSVSQPLGGVVGQRIGPRRAAGLGLLAAAVFSTLVGYAPHYGVLAVFLLLGALGVSLFHPNAAAQVTEAGGRRDLRFAVFMNMGPLGLSLSPLIGTMVFHRAGPRALIFLAVPGFLFGAWILFLSRRKRSEAPSPKRPRPSWAEVIHAFQGTGGSGIRRLFAVAVLRAMVFSVFIFYISVLNTERGWSLEEGGRVLSLYLACTCAGGITGGYLAAHVSRKVLVLLSTLAPFPLLFGFLSMNGPLALVLLGAAGFLFQLGTPLMVVMAQELRPNMVGTVSGVMMGLAWGLSAALLGPVSLLFEVPGVGVSGALMLVCLGLVPAGFLAFGLPWRHLDEMRKAMDRRMAGRTSYA